MRRQGCGHQTRESRNAQPRHGRTLPCSYSLLFGIIHVSLVPFIPLAIFGAVLVLLYEYTGSIWTPIIAHCIFNTATLINILYPGILLPYGT